MACGIKPSPTDVHTGMVSFPTGAASEQYLIPSNSGVYFAKDGNTSFGNYAQGGATWKNSQLYPQSCAALAEIVNLPEKFVSHNPHYVVADTTWIVWYVSLDHHIRLLNSHIA